MSFIKLENPTNLPSAVSESYQRQNTNAQAVRWGMDTTIVKFRNKVIEGTTPLRKIIAELMPGGLVDMKGSLFRVTEKQEFQITLHPYYYNQYKRYYYIVLKIISSTIFSCELVETPGTYSEEWGGWYAEDGNRILKWELSLDYRRNDYRITSGGINYSNAYWMLIKRSGPFHENEDGVGYGHIVGGTTEKITMASKKLKIEGQLSLSFSSLFVCYPSTYWTLPDVGCCFFRGPVSAGPGGSSSCQHTTVWNYGDALLSNFCFFTPEWGDGFTLISHIILWIQYQYAGDSLGKETFYFNIVEGKPLNLFVKTGETTYILDTSRSEFFAGVVKKLRLTSSPA